MVGLSIYLGLSSLIDMLGETLSVTSDLQIVNALQCNSTEHKVFWYRNMVRSSIDNRLFCPLTILTHLVPEPQTKMPFLLYHARYRSLHRPGKLLLLTGSLLVKMGVGQVVGRGRELEH